MKAHAFHHAIPFLAAVLLLPAVAAAATTSWTGGGADSDWFNASNWDSGVPGAGDNAIIAGSPSVDLTNATAALGSVAVSGGTVTFSGWTTALTATNVLLTGGTVTLPSAFADTGPSNRVWVVCTNFFLGAGATINADYLGFTATASSAGDGPGAGGARAGAGYGGFGANYASLGGFPYGSESAPLAPGSAGGSFGGNLGGHGGGAVRIQANANVTINGTISANGKNGASNAGGGSGGGVFISCQALYGTNGTVRANGGNAGGSSAGPAGGGRIAAVYNGAAQSSAGVPDITFSTRAGTANNYVPDMGTLYFPDAQLLSSTIPHSGQIIIPAFSNWATASLTISNGWVRFPADGMHITVTNDLLITGSSGGLAIGGGTFFTNGLFADGVYYNRILGTDNDSPPSLAVGGDLIVTNGGILQVYAAVTNAVTADHGALLAVTGNVSVAGGSAVYAYSHPTNGGSVLFRAADVAVRSTATLSADGGGFAPGNRTAANSGGYGPGAGGSRAGGGYGGFGGNFANTGGLPYGTASAPIHAGSGGGNYSLNLGGSGGGVLRIESSGTVTVDGTVSANGLNGGNNSGGGAGGGVYIACDVFAGNGGTVRADGGDTASSAGNGGGGRISVAYDPGLQSGAAGVDVTFSADAGSGGAYVADLGTVSFPDLQLVPEALNGFNGQLVGFSSWAPAALALTNSWVRLPSDGFQLTVTNDIRIDGASARLDVGGANILQNGSYRDSTYTEQHLYNGAASTISCGGDVVLTNSGILRIYAGVTNPPATFYGAELSVTGDVTVAPGSSLQPVSHPTNGGAVLIRADNVTVSPGASITAERDGYAGGSVTAPVDDGFGPGAGGHRSGGGHGGAGGYASGGGVYDSSNAPVQAGSGGGSYGTSPAGSGGGLVRIAADCAVTVDGTVSASGVSGSGHAGAGSGGGIYVDCTTFAGGGHVVADGGNNTASGGGGGGGRIAVWRAFHTYSGTTSVEPGTGTFIAAGTGTVVWVGKGPAITNEPATNVAADSVDMVATLTSTGIASAEVYCFWGLTNQGESMSAWANTNYLDTNSPGRVTNSVSSLSPATQYYYSFYATNAYGDNWGTPATLFSTVGGAAVDNDGGATGVTQTGALLRGVVTSGNPTPDTYICWGDNDPAVDSTGAWDTVIDMDLQGAAFQTNIAGLLANKTYYYRCYVTNINGEGWAPTATNFTTLAPMLTIDNPAPVTEGDSGTVPLDFTVTISATSDVPVTVVFAAGDGTATAPADYAATNGILTIAAGQVADTIRVLVQGDSEDEYPFQDLFMDLSGATNATIVDAQGRGVISDDDDVNQVKTWDGTGNWNSFTNWTPAGPPGPADDAVINSGQVTLSNAANVTTLTITNGSTMVFMDWDSELTASQVSIPNGTVTLPSAFTDAGPSNRVWFTCTNLALAAGSTIDADAKGFAAAGAPSYGYGPGSATGGRGGAGYGGIGGNFGWLNGWSYGSPSAPLDPGSGADGAAGGGAVRIDAGSEVRVDGTITANGGNSSGLTGSGSGGSIYISCSTFAGTSGLLSADGGEPNSNNGGGGGGRIAVAYNATLQAAEPVPTVQFSAKGGQAPSYDGEYGTIHLTDPRFLEPVMSRFDGELRGFTSWTIGALTVSNSLVHFPDEGFALLVSNDLTVVGTAQLLIGGDTLRPGSAVGPSYGPHIRYTASTSAPSLTVGGDLVLTNSAELHVFSAMTNSTTAEYGALVDVSGDIMVRAGASLYMVTHPTNGGYARVHADNMAISAGGTLSAFARGYAGEVQGGNSYGPAAGGSRSGAGYGGAGGYSLPGGTYGNSNAPVEPGSAGGGGLSTGAGGIGGNGGGFVWVDIDRTTLVDGLLTADGMNGGGSHAGGGSGGAIFVNCRTFTGDGTVSTDGGDGGSTSSGGGGGGRIAIHYRRTTPAELADIRAGMLDRVLITTTNPDFSGTLSVAGGEAGTFDGQPGTSLFLTVVPPTGTLFILR